MKTTIEGAPAFAYIHVDLEPGESVVAESDAMSSMSGDLDLDARTNGGCLSALGKSLFGGESFFVSVYTNNADSVRRVTLTQGTPGNIRQVELNGESICLQPGAYIASTPGLRLGVKWAGFASWIAHEGLFKLVVSGTGTLWYGAYGGLVEKGIAGGDIVDTSHLVAYQPHMTLHVQLAGGIFSSFFGGEGLVTRIEGKGKIVLQSRSMEGLADWLRPHL
jgi:uncharacterized protein (TIGR00266 family)